MATCPLWTTGANMQCRSSLITTAHVSQYLQGTPHGPRSTALRRAAASMQGKKTGTLGDLAIFSYQASKPMPTVEGGMGMFDNRLHYERATAYGEYTAPEKFPANSPVHRYAGTGYGRPTPITHW